MFAEDLASALGRKVHTVREWIRRGLIPASKLGRHYIVRREALLEHLEKRERVRQQRRAHSRAVLGLVAALPRRRRGVSAARLTTAPVQP
jgi:excisionase family DNA binding protein